MQFHDEYSDNRAVSAFYAESIDDALNKIFKFQTLDNDIYEKSEILSPRLRFGESFSSLFNVLAEHSRSSLKADVYAMNVGINRWIDRSIDCGGATPKYERVISENGTPYWARYIHAGSNLG